MTQPLTPARQEERALSPLGEVKRTLANNLKTVNALLAGYTTPERFMGGIVTAMQINPDLALCSPQSVLLASLRVAQLRLSPDPALGQAYLIPRDGRAEFQLGYRGTLQLLYRSPIVRNVRYNVVRRGDRFRWIDGASWVLEHEPGTEGWPTTWDELIAAWAIIELTNGGQIPRVMYADEIRRHKERGRGKQPAWQTDLGAMAAKTVLGDVARRGPLDGESLLGVNLDHQGEAGLPQQTADLEEMVAPQAAAERAAAAIVGKSRPLSRRVLTEEVRETAFDAGGNPVTIVTPAGTVEEDYGSILVRGTPQGSPQRVERAESFGEAGKEATRAVAAAYAAGETTRNPKPWQPILDLNLPRVGDTIAERLQAAGLDSYERICEAGAADIASRIDGVSTLGAQAIVAFAEKQLMGEPEPDHTPTPQDLTDVGPAKQAEIPLATEPEPEQPSTMRFLAPVYSPPPPTKQELLPITGNERYALERHAIRTKRAGAPAGPEGDKIAIECLNAFVEDTFDKRLADLPRYFFRAVMRWAEAPGLNPEIEEITVLRQRGHIKP